MGQVHIKKKKHDSIKKNLFIRSKEDYFIRNGAILLEQLVQISEGRDTGASELKIFSNKEIEKATNNYDERAITYKFSEQAIIYKASLDNDIAASVMVPASFLPNPDLSNTFINGISTITVMNHENIVKIYGCCLETCIPMVVSENLQNGSILFQHLHSDTPTKRLQWGDLIRVVTETAYALSYIHNALRKPLVHRDVSSLSIFIDSSNRAKLSGFGHAVSITREDRSRRWPIKGAMGYIDPEYIETQKLTDKCDVYSFGVLMIEVLTRRQPSLMARDGINLVDVFVSAVEENQMKDMISIKVLEQAFWDEIQQVVQLALDCVATKGINRPTMIDVVGDLWKIQGRDKK